MKCLIKILIVVMMVGFVGVVRGAVVIDNPDQLVGAFNSQWIGMPSDEDKLMEEVDGVPDNLRLG